MGSAARALPLLGRFGQAVVLAVAAYGGCRPCSHPIAESCDIHRLVPRDDRSRERSFRPDTRTVHDQTESRDAAGTPFRMFRVRSRCIRHEVGPHSNTPRSAERQGPSTRGGALQGDASQRLEKREARRACASLRLRPAIFVPLGSRCFLHSDALALLWVDGSGRTRRSTGSGAKRARSLGAAC